MLPGFRGLKCPIVVVNPPVWTVDPHISGTRGAGNTLTADFGTATGATSMAGEWMADGIPTGQHGTSFVDSVAYNGRTLSVEVDASNSAGHAYRASNDLTSPDYSNVAFRSPFTGANGTQIAAAGNIGFDGNGNPAAPIIVGGGDNDDGSGANQAARQALVTIQNNALNAVQGSFSASAKGTKVLAECGSSDQIVEVTCVNGNPPMMMIGRYADGLNFLYSRWAANANGNTYFEIFKYEAGVATALNTNQMGCVGLYQNGSKFRWRPVGGFLFFEYDMAGTGVWTPAFAPTSFQGPFAGSSPVQQPLPANIQGTKAGIAQRTALTQSADNLIIAGIDQALSIVTAVPGNTNQGIEFAIAGSYTGNPTSYTIEVKSLAGQPLLAATAPAASSISGGQFAITSVPAPNAVPFTGGSVRVIVRDNLGRAKSTIVAIPDFQIIPPTSLGLNITSLGLWDIGSEAGWLDPSDYSKNILRLGVQPTGVQIASSEDGAGATVKRGWDNAIYPTNGLGLTSYRMVWDRLIPSSQSGTWTFQVPAGTVVTGIIQSANITGWTYNSVTGIGSFTYTYNGANFLLNLVITTASMSAGGTIPILKLASAVGAMDPVSIANVKMISSRNRYLDVIPQNNDELYPFRTSLAHPSRQPSQRYRGNNSREKIIAHCNLCDNHILWGVLLFNSDALISQDAAYIAANLNPGKDSTYCIINEPFNAIFKGTNDVRVAGVRRGYAAPGATPGTAVPETVYDTLYPTLLTTGQGNPRFTTRAFLNGEKFIYNGFNGWQVYQAIGDQPSGAAFADVTNANFSVIYSNSDTDRAGKMFISQRSAEMKALIDAEYDAVGRPRPHYEAPGFAAGGFDFVQPILNQANGHLTFDRISAAHYWGGGVGGQDMGRYTSNNIVGWTTADKEPLYTTANQAAAISAAVDKFFAAAPAVIESTVATVPAYKQASADFNKSKGLSKNAILTMEYEFAWHVVFGNTGGWPDDAARYSDRSSDGSSAIAYAVGALRKYTAPAWSAVEAYSVGNVRKSGTTLYRCILGHTNQAPPNATYWVAIGSSVDDGIYKCIQAHSNQPCSNAAYWTQIATAAVAAENPSRMQLLYQAIYRDPRMYDMTLLFLQKMQRVGGGDMYWYQQVSGGITANGTWAVFIGEDDNIVTGGPGTNWIAKALKDFKGTP